MRVSVKALLLSAFIFPGVGQLVLQRTILGYSLITIAGLATLTIFIHVYNSAMQVVARITSGEVPPDFLVIHQLVTEQQASMNTGSLNTALIVLIIAWLVGIVDALRSSTAHNDS